MTHRSPSASHHVEDGILKSVNLIVRHIEVSAGIPVLTGLGVIVENLSVRVVKRAF
jgi:hypothetical protein